MNIITLTTDFGLEDPFVGVMKGVILSLCPEARVIDLSHNVKSADIRQAGFILETSHSYFPADTVHIAVVDPGVGTARRGLGVFTDRGVFIAPDNGVLSRILGMYPGAEIRCLENRELTLQPVSSTFHGRDVFAPMAAHLCKGVDFSSVGPVITDTVLMEVPSYRLEGNILSGAVIHIDVFGNIVTNVPVDFKPMGIWDDCRLHLGVEYKLKFTNNYKSIPGGELGIIPGSSGYLEIAMNLGSAASHTGAATDDEFSIEFAGDI